MAASVSGRQVPGSTRWASGATRVAVATATRGGWAAAGVPDRLILLQPRERGDCQPTREEQDEQGPAGQEPRTPPPGRRGRGGGVS